MSSYKVDRLQEDLRRELTNIFRTLKDPRIHGMISIVRIELARDLSSAKVYVSSMDGIESAKEAVVGLKSAAGYIRREVSLRIEMRRSPELRFIADNSIEYSAHVNKILKDLNHD